MTGVLRTPTVGSNGSTPVAAPAPVIAPAPARRRWRRWLAVAIAMGVIAVAVLAVRAYVARETGPRYRVAAVERGPLTATVSATGNLNAVVTVLVGSQVSGTIKALAADFNTVVHTGQVIAQIDPALFEAAVDQARADLAAARSAVLNQEAQIRQARTNVENARAAHAEAHAQTAKAAVAVVDTSRTLARQTALFQQSLVAESDRDAAQTAFDAALAQQEAAEAHERALASAIETATAQLAVVEAALETARNQVDQKQAALAQAQINLDHTTIRSPVDGVVVNRAVDVGQTVAATLQAPTLFTIARDLTRMQVEASVDEADIGRIGADTPVTFSVDAFPGRTFVGEVSQIRKAPQVVQNVVTYTVVAAVANPRGELLPGMTANVKFVVAKRAAALKVPNAALRFRPSTAPVAPAGARVWVRARDGALVAVPVTTGVTDGMATEIVAGALTPGQEVVTGVEESPASTPNPLSPVPRLRF